MCEESSVVAEENEVEEDALNNEPVWDPEKYVAALDPTSVIEYTPKQCRDWPEHFQPKFNLKVLSARESAKIQDSLTKAIMKGKSNDKEFNFTSAGMQIDALDQGLVGWSDFRDAKGGFAEYDKSVGKGSMVNINRIPREWIPGMAEIILEGRELSEGQEKNSD